MSALSDTYGNYSPGLQSLGDISTVVGGTGGASAGNGAPDASTPGVVYVQWDSDPANQLWDKGSDGLWH